MAKESFPHKLDLYRMAVQHPMAEISFLMRAYGWANESREPRILREDFSGTSVIAMTWLLMDPDRQAIAVDSHEPTLQWAEHLAKEELGHIADQLQFCHGDVLSIAQPQADLIAALNFSSFGFHCRESLLGYLKHARTCLKPGGVLVLDAYGGLGAMRIGTQSRMVQLPGEFLEKFPGALPGTLPGAGGAFEYQWEQASFDAMTHRTDCRIHFVMADGTVYRNAFQYDWRLWTLVELQELLAEANFGRVTVWCDTLCEETGQSDGLYEPLDQLPAREDWVAYITAAQ